jgi:hypothetical protein
MTSDEGAEIIQHYREGAAPVGTRPACLFGYSLHRLKTPESARALDLARSNNVELGASCACSLSCVFFPVVFLAVTFLTEVSLSRVALAQRPASRSLVLLRGAVTEATLGRGNKCSISRISIVFERPRSLVSSVTVRALQRVRAMASASGRPSHHP